MLLDKWEIEGFWTECQKAFSARRFIVFELKVFHPEVFVQ